MKAIKSVLMFLMIIATAYSCDIYDDLSNCPPPGNLHLTFSYKGDTNDAAMFKNMIDDVTLYCYKSTGELVTTKTVDKSSLNAYQGTSFDLTPGDYKIISWANVNSGVTEVAGTANLSSGRVHHPDYVSGTDIKTNDHLYYGELAITVPATGAVTGDIAHRGAHINVSVHVSGVGFDNDPTSWPVIKITNLMPEYTMQMADAQPYTTTYVPTVSWTTTHNTAAAEFCTLRFSDNNDIKVRIEKQNGTLLHTVTLKDFMTANSITVDGKNEATVAVLIKFHDGKFSLSIPEWMQTVVKPSV